MAKAKIDEAVIGLRVDMGDVPEAIKKVKGDIEEVGDEADKAGAKVEGAFTKAGTAIEGKTAGVRKFAGALSSVAGVATGLIGVFGLLAGAFVGVAAILKKLNDPSSKESIEKTKDNLQALFDTASGDVAAAGAFPVFDAIKEEIADLEEEIEIRLKNIDAIAAGGVGGGQGVMAARDAAQKRLDATRKELKDKLEEQESFRIKTRDANKKAFTESLKELSSTIELTLMPSDKRIRESARLQKDALIKAADEARVDASNKDLRTALALIDKKAKAEIKAGKTVITELGAFEKNQTQSTSAFTTRLDTMITELREINSSIGRNP